MKLGRAVSVSIAMLRLMRGACTCDTLCLVPFADKPFLVGVDEKFKVGDAAADSGTVLGVVDGAGLGVRADGGHGGDDVGALVDGVFDAGEGGVLGEVDAVLAHTVSPPDSGMVTPRSTETLG